MTQGLSVNTPLSVTASGVPCDQANGETDVESSLADQHNYFAQSVRIPSIGGTAARIER
jgi:hypothetical protein